MTGPDGDVRMPYKALNDWLADQPKSLLKRKSQEAELIFRRMGITFAVYGSDEATERLIPFDIILRIISASERRRLAAGIGQRVSALNAFLLDIDHRQ